MDIKNYGKYEVLLNISSVLKKGIFFQVSSYSGDSTSFKVSYKHIICENKKYIKNNKKNKET